MTSSADSIAVSETDPIVEAADMLAESYVPEREYTSSQAQTEQTSAVNSDDNIIVINNSPDPTAYVQRWAAF